MLKAGDKQVAAGKGFPPGSLVPCTNPGLILLHSVFSWPAPLERRGLVLFPQVPAHSPPNQKNNSKMVLLLNILPARLTAFLVSGCFLPVLKKSGPKKSRNLSFQNNSRATWNKNLTVWRLIVYYTNNRWRLECSIL